MAWSLVLMVGGAACSSSAALPLPKAQRLTVVTTAYPLFEAAANIGGSRVHAVNLLPLDPFATPTEQQRQQLLDADLVITLGRNAQPELQAVLDRRTKATLSVLDQFGVQDLPVTGGVDPYVWLNPQNMIRMEQGVHDRLVSMDGAGAPMYDKYTSNLRKDINRLDVAFSRTISTCATRSLVANDNRYKYLADHYGLVYVVYGLNQSYPEGFDALRQVLDEYHPNTVFQPVLPSLKDANHILDNYGVRVAVLDPVAAQTDQARRGGSNYISVMYLNLDALRSALSCTAQPITGH